MPASPARPRPQHPRQGFGAPTGGSSVKHMEADGPVTLISKDQVGTGDHATYDKAENKVYLNGNVTLSQGTNVTQGDRLIYDLTNGQAQVFSGTTNAPGEERLHAGQRTPGEQPDKAAPASAEEAGGAEAQDRRQAGRRRQTARRRQAARRSAPPRSRRRPRPMRPPSNRGSGLDGAVFALQRQVSRLGRRVGFYRHLLVRDGRFGQTSTPWHVRHI